MQAGAARALVALLLVAVFGACARSEPASIGVGLEVVTPTTTTTTAPPAAADNDATAPPSLPASVRLPSGAGPRAARTPPTVGGRIVIPRLGLDLVTYEGVDPWTLRHGPGRWEVTAQPGRVGNAVFAGHRTTYTRPFYDIDLIQVGDEVTFVNPTGVFTYRVTRFFVVDDSDVWIAEPTDTPTFTLFACHPKGSERQRYVVQGDLARTTAAEPAPAPADNGHAQPRRCVLCVRR